MVTGWSSQTSPFSQQSMWNLGAAQAQMEAIAAALMPLAVAPSGRVQVPSIEIENTPTALIVTAFLPGVDPKAVNVRATGKSLTFSGQRQSGYRSPLVQSLGINYFQQTVPLPERVRDRQMQVAYHQGAIVVTLPKPQGWSQRLGQGWQRARNWLGRSLKNLGQRLLEDR
ncbi:Hsp20/alpha crystallin family protein [Nodosilinea nodulosa]|uniref:Hsp20/alpha crystallin family protein n=1 Tax=Nodosilinea nodulosa TaxID=416001 RepID=UPI000A0204B2|nr:Hsp20 family protein [Nodosilinea nodulosa]